VEVAIAYDSLLSNVVRSNRFWMQGGSIQLAGEFWHGLGVEADISGLHTQNANNTWVGLDMVTTTFGPRYRWSPAHHRYSIFGHALVGEANGFHSVFPDVSSATDSADSFERPFPTSRGDRVYAAELRMRSSQISQWRRRAWPALRVIFLVFSRSSFSFSAIDQAGDDGRGVVDAFAYSITLSR
jgi:hypothetical protein